MRNRGHGRSGLAAIAIVGALGFLWMGCATRTEMSTAPETLGKGGATTFGGGGNGKSVTSSNDYCEPFTAFDFRNFSNPTQIDNLWLPLTPGTRYVLEGVANRGGGLLPHRVEFTVTNVVKEIHGIRCVVVWDEDFNEGKLAEAELAFFAQDNDGNIWTMGEYPEEYDIASGEFLGAPSTWIHGLDGAQAGNAMLADPAKTGSGYYLQGRVDAIQFLDCAKVFKIGEKTCVPVGCYTNVLVTDEKSPFDGGGHQRKYYAPGIGNIKIAAVGDPEGEELVLTERRTLTSAELAAAREAVLRLDARGYQYSEVYSLTKPAQ